MDKPETFEIHLASLLWWVLIPVLGISGFGTLATWLMAGLTGVIAQWVAVTVVLAVMLSSGSLTVYAARKGASLASTAFMGASLMRMLLCPALVGLAWLVTDLPANVMGVWLVIAYLACLGLEVVWIVRALRRSVVRGPATDKDETTTSVIS